MDEKKSKNTGRLLIAITAVCWGLAGVCVKSITWSSLSIIFVRCIVSLIMLLITKRSFKIHFSKINTLGGLSVIVTGILYIIALKLTNAGTAIVLQYVAPIIIFLYSVLFKNRKTTKIEVLLLITVFAGIVISFADSLDATHVVGNIIALASGFTFAAQILITNDENCESMDAMQIANIIGIVVGLPFFLFDGTVVFTASNVIWVMIMAVFQYGLANVCYSKGINKLEAVEASLILTIEPIFNPIPVAIFCGEMMGPLAIVGAIIVIISVTAFAVYQNKKGNA